LKQRPVFDEVVRESLVMDCAATRAHSGRTEWSRCSRHERTSDQAVPTITRPDGQILTIGGAEDPEARRHTQPGR
jgi:hypothetical protein